MRIPRYWARGVYHGPETNDRGGICAWGWSDESQFDAEQQAVLRAERIAKILNDLDDDMGSLRRGQEYEYAAYPLREEIIETHKSDDDGKIVAAVTRNRYGSLVLNTANVCFVDVDYAEPSNSGLGFIDKIKWAFSSSMRAEAAEAVKQRTVARIHAWADQHPSHSLRLYRTARGLRLLFTDQLYDPLSPQVEQLFDELGCDRLYKALTQKQECFRARLTPKPWRCGFTQAAYGHLYLRQDKAGPEKAEQELALWVAGYEKVIQNFGVCELVELFGRPRENAEISRVLAIHDRYSLGRPGLPLA